jgi:carbon monoxide dehydrogenase subunit G
LEAVTRISPLHRAYGNIRPTTGSPAQKIETIDEKTYDAVVKQKAGPIKVTLKFRNVLTEVQPPHRLVLEGEGEDITKLGHMKQKTIVELSETGDGNVEVSYKSDVAIVGKLAMFGDRVMKSKAKDVEREFTQNLLEKLKGEGVRELASC